MQLVPAQLHLVAPPVSLPSARLRHAPVVAAISIRGVERDDVAALADLTTDALFGEASVLADGPIIYLQRQQIRQQQQRKLERRLNFEGESECKFFVAEDSDSIVGCLDLAVHLFDNSALRFELEVDTMPEDGGDYRWSPYIASLSVSKAYRRSGVGRRLVQEAEGWARQSSYSEVMLEVRARRRMELDARTANEHNCLNASADEPERCLCCYAGVAAERRCDLLLQMRRILGRERIRKGRGWRRCRGSDAPRALVGDQANGQVCDAQDARIFQPLAERYSTL